MKTEKTAKILQLIKKRDQQIMKHWKPYDGPPDWDFAVLNAPKKELEEGGEDKIVCGEARRRVAILSVPMCWEMLKTSINGREV
jgi:hypothetical protein